MILKEMVKIIIYLIAIFSVIGGIDRIFGNRYGYGKKFEEGIMTMGVLALSMLGILSFSPVMTEILKPLLTPIVNLYGGDAGIFPGIFLANDMGGYSLAKELAIKKEIGLFSGLILSSTLGATLSFSIPVALGIIKKEDERYFSLGMLAGIVTAPLGCLIGGVVAGFDIKNLSINLIPVFLIIAILSYFLMKYPTQVGKYFGYFGKLLFIITMTGLIFQILEILLGVKIITGMLPINEGIKIVGKIGITLSGAYPLLLFITRVFDKGLEKIGELLEINKFSCAGLISSLAHNIPMFHTFSDMDKKGKIINSAFSVSASFVFGSHLGFTSGVNEMMVLPVIIAKLTGGVLAVLLGIIIFKKND